MKSLMPQIDSNDGLFHNGNPATGEQGTRVTDTWLNNLQDRVRDVQAEAHYVLQKAGFTPKEETQTQLYQAIVKIIDDNRKTASLTQKGETQLYTGYDSQSEDLALTPKTAYQLKQFIDSNTRALGNVIPNSKKSSAVNSNSAETVATSVAVKTAYDKGVDAKNAADNAQRTADNAQRTANDGVSKANAAQISANQAKSAADEAQSSANAANNNANGRISKTDISHATNGTNKAKVASEFALNELNKKLSTVIRKNYTKTIKGTNASFDNATQKNINLEGETIIHPDGKVEQIIHFKAFRVWWFYFEAKNNSERLAVEIPVPLWTAMPNKITNVTATFSRTESGRSFSFGAEAFEWWPPSWAFERQNNIKDRLWLYTIRHVGNQDEHIDLWVKVEGY